MSTIEKKYSEIVVSLITSRGLFMKYDNNDNFFHTTLITYHILSE